MWGVTVRGAGMPSGVSASPQGLRWPDSRVLPRIPQKPGAGADTASKGPGGTPPAAELAGSLLGPGRTLEGQAGQTQVPGDRGASDFLWKQMGCFQACTLHMLPKPWHWFRAPPRPAPSSGTHGAPRHSVAPRVSHSHTLAHTQAGQETLGSEAEASLL